MTGKLLLEFVFKLFFEFLHLRPDYILAIGLIWVQGEIILVIVLRLVKISKGRDFGDDRVLKYMRRGQLFFILLRQIPLLLGMIKNSRTILCSLIVSLPVKCSGIMHIPEDLK